MSTNFYLYGHDTDDNEREDPRYHIGKRYAAGGGQTAFIWAMDPFTFAAAALAVWPADSPFVVDESEQEYSLGQFMEVLAGNVTQETHSIGIQFC